MIKIRYIVAYSGTSFLGNNDPNSCNKYPSKKIGEILITIANGSKITLLIILYSDSYAKRLLLIFIFSSRLSKISQVRDIF